jgi:hypothetical protein
MKRREQQRGKPTTSSTEISSPIANTLHFRSFLGGKCALALVLFVICAVVWGVEFPRVQFGDGPALNKQTALDASVCETGDCSEAARLKKTDTEALGSKKLRMAAGAEQTSPITAAGNAIFR